MTASADLRCHPTTPCAAVSHIRVDVARSARDGLVLSYRIAGDTASLRLPPPAAARRADGLWQHTCLEAFLRADGSDAYFEFNFSPSGAWAAFRFEGRRVGRTVPELTAPRMEISLQPEALVMDIQLSLEKLPELAQATLLAGLAAVIEDQESKLSYWALAHGAARPDFHDPASFALRVAAP